MKKKCIAFAAAAALLISILSMGSVFCRGGTDLDLVSGRGRIRHRSRTGNGGGRGGRVLYHVYIGRRYGRGILLSRLCLRQSERGRSGSD